MRLALERFDVRGLVLAALDERLRLSLEHGEHLGGHVETGPNGLKVDARAAATKLASVVYRGMSTTVSALGGGVLERVALRYADQGGTRVSGDADRVLAKHLRVHGTSFEVTGALEVHGFRLVIEPGRGAAHGEKLVLENAALVLGEGDAAQIVHADRLVATSVEVSWGDEGFRFRAASLEGAGLRCALGDVHLEAGDAGVQALAIDGSDIRADRVELSRVRLDMSFSAAPARRADEPPRTSIPPVPEGPEMLAWEALDGLSGDFNVDLAVDLAVPILGRRRATHRFRVPIEAGSIDYMRLEGDLSTLENTLLDFALRGDALVLERGIPLLPTRGFGKPIVVWDLSPSDRALAEQKRVRLAVLPHARLSSEAKDEGAAQREPSSRSGVALRRLGLLELDARLSLALDPPLVRGHLRPARIGRLRLHGNIFHEVEGAVRDGLLEGGAEEVEIAVDNLPIGARRLHLGRLSAGRIEPLQILFSGLKPRAIGAEVHALAAVHLSLTTLATA